MTQYAATSPEYRKEISLRMRMNRAEHRLSQTQLAKLVGVSRNTISRIEAEEKPASVTTLDALEDTLEKLEEEYGDS